MAVSEQHYLIDKENLKLKLELEKVKLKTAKAEAKKLAKEAIVKKTDLKIKEADIILAKEMTLQLRLTNEGMQLKQTKIATDTEDSRKRRQICSTLPRKRIKSKMETSTSSSTQSTTSTDNPATASIAESRTSSSRYDKSHTTDNHYFFNNYMCENVYEFDICSLLNDNECLLDDNRFNNNIENCIRNYLESFESIDDMSEAILQKSFDSLMNNLLTIFIEQTSLKYLNTAGARYLDTFSPDCSLTYKNVSIRSENISRVLSDFVVCFGELKAPKTSQLSEKTIGQIGRYLYHIYLGQYRKRCYAFLCEFNTITFLYCDKISGLPLSYYRSQTLHLFEYPTEKQSNVDVIRISKQSKEIYFNREPWKMFTKFLTMHWKFYTYTMLNISPHDNLLGDRYQIIDRLGMGATSIVYLLKKKKEKFKSPESSHYIIKISQDIAYSICFQNEIQIIKQLRAAEKTVGSPNFPNINMLFSSEKFLVFTDNLTYVTAINYEQTIKLIDIVKFLYENNIIHRDIRPPNVMKDCNNNLRLIDFDFAYKFEETESRKLLPIEGATTYASIEFLRKKLQLIQNAPKRMFYDYQRNFDLFCTLNVIVYKTNEEVRRRMTLINSNAEPGESQINESLKLWELMAKENKTYDQLLKSFQNLNEISQFTVIQSILKKNYLNLQKISNFNYTG